MNPNVTFTQFIQLPDFGAAFSHVGKIAKSIKGSAKATAKPNIPVAAPIILPEVPNSTSRKPIMGAVQEKLTSTSVKAIRKIDSRPVFSDALLSTAFTQREGSTISKAPNSDAPKTTSKRKKKILKKALVERAFNADAPNNAVTISPKERYMTMIEMP